MGAGELEAEIQKAFKDGMLQVANKVNKRKRGIEDSREINKHIQHGMHFYNESNNPAHEEGLIAVTKSTNLKHLFVVLIQISIYKCYT